MMVKKRHGRKNWLYDKIDLKYLSTKMGLWIFSAIVSFMPIAYTGINEQLVNNYATLEFSIIVDSILSSTNTIYSLVTLSTLALADALCGIFIDKRESKSMTFFYCLTHIAVIMFEVLLYASCQIEKVDNMKSINKKNFLLIIVLSFLTYVNISTSNKGENK